MFRGMHKGIDRGRERGLRILWRERKLGRFAAVKNVLPLLLMLVACAKQKRIHLRPERSFDDRGVVFIPFARSEVERFFGPDERPCAQVGPRPRDNLVGWQSPNDSAACAYDTFVDGGQSARLEFRWQSEIPQDGDYDLVTLGYPVGAWGRVVSRGSYYGNYFSRAALSLEARAPQCAASWSLELAKAIVAGPWDRSASFQGWVQIPDVALRGCRAHETIDVRLRLQGESNRGGVDVDWFGFSAVKDDDVSRIFGLRLRPNAR